MESPAASYFVSHFGFTAVAYRGPETGSYLTSSYVVANGAVRFVFTGPITGPENEWEVRASEDDHQLLNEIHDHLRKHGDGVKDIAFEVNDVEAIWAYASKRNGTVITQPTALNEGTDGEVRLATIQTYGDTVHTLIDRSKYRGLFLPGFKAIAGLDKLNSLLPPVELIDIDHCVGNQPWDGLDGAVKYYERVFSFHRYWSVDDKDMCSDYSAMRSIVVTSPNARIKMPMNEPAAGLKKSQIQEFVQYYQGAGCQHIAFSTKDIVQTVENLSKRGVEFLTVPDSYYTVLRNRLAVSKLDILESLEQLQKYNILLDFDEGGYLLQIFTKHVVERPTVFLEIIQRHNFDGFGAGNFKSLFEAFERDQEARGNL
ncbi:4-hydroxyphenylpyruvate dioxygenase 2 [Aspergillus caelatus]|uniref:4-hydroxyphenylpyruvate dioxygenase n=1 Tax=Aspergillus caelatus TaxID=61420 RepID=A0A5N6ZPH3_9EURO|nr:4-hydroxyphenylpyruvate dioxygenase 2 [Aspergillus caelatus]KAE8359335.1 4-hydroxyphenylpyruvate dioxygenase 2 [Aspergillus caelatus]